MLSPSDVWRDCVVVAEGRITKREKGGDKEKGVEEWVEDSSKIKAAGHAQDGSSRADEASSSSGVACAGSDISKQKEDEGPGERRGVKVHYVGFDSQNDEWLPKDSERIRWTAEFGRVCDKCGESEHRDGAVFNHGQTRSAPCPRQMTPSKVGGEADGVTLCLRCVSGMSGHAQPGDSSSTTADGAGTGPEALGGATDSGAEGTGTGKRFKAGDEVRKQLFEPFLYYKMLRSSLHQGRLGTRIRENSKKGAVFSQVLIHGLTSPAGLELNDRRGKVVSFEEEAGRFVVAVVGITRQKRLKEDNLRPLAEALAERKRLAVAFEHV